MNLFFRELKANRKSLIIWCMGIFFMVVAGMSKFQAAGTSGASINELISKMPKSLQAIMGTGSLDLSTATGFYGMVFSYLLLMAAIHALMLGAAIIAKEERDKTAEFLLVKPISRSRIITAKLSAAFVNVVIFNVVTLLFSVAMVSHYSKGNESLKDIYLLMIGMFLLQLVFTTLGSGIAAMSKKPKRAAAFGTAILLILYILSIFIELNQHLDLLKYLTPFKYFEAKTVMADGALTPVYIILSVAVMAILLGLTYTFFKKRDMNV